MKTGDSPLSRWFRRLGERIVAAPLLVVLAIGAVTAGLGAAAAQVRVNNATDIFFVEDDPLLMAHRRFQARFGSDEFVMVYVEGEDLYSPAAFRAVDALVKQMEALTYEGRPAFTGIVSPFHAPTMRERAGSIAIEPLLKNLEGPSPQDLARAKADATQHPVYRDLVVNPDGTAGAIIGTLQSTGKEQYQNYVAEQMLRFTDKGELRALGALVVGNPVFNLQVNSATVEESAIFGSGAILVSVLALFVMFRRKRQVSAAIGVVVLAVTWTIGLMALCGVEMSLISIILPLVIVIMGLGSGVHIINEFREQRLVGKGRRSAVVEALAATGAPCMLTALTTGVGFLTMLTAPVAPMRMLGIFAAVGVLLAFILAITLVPAILSMGDDRPDKSSSDAERRIDERANHWFGNLADWVVARAARVTGFFVLLALACSAGLWHSRVESFVLQAFREDQPFRQAVEHVDKNLGGSTSLELVIDSGAPRGVYDPAFLRRLETLQQWILDTQGDVAGATLSLPDLLKEVNYAFTGQRSLPDSRDRAAQLMFLYESGDGDPRMVIDHAARRARLSVRMRQTTTKRALALEASLREKASALFDSWEPAPEALLPDDATPQAEAKPDAPNEAAADAGDEDGEVLIIDHGDDEPHDAEDDDEIVIIEDDAPPPASASASSLPEDDDPPLPAGASRVELAGTAQLFVHLAEYVIKSQITSFGLAALIISVLMVLMLRSVRLGLAVMVPNILPIVSTYGIMGWLGISIDWLTALIAVAALGVAVDGTIHIGTRYRNARELGLDAKGAAHLVMTSIGRALVVTSCVLSAGFLVVAPSILSSLARFGLLMALCLFLALLFDLIMTTAVLAWLNPGGDGLDAKKHDRRG